MKKETESYLRKLIKEEIKKLKELKFVKKDEEVLLSPNDKAKILKSREFRAATDSLNDLFSLVQDLTDADPRTTSKLTIDLLKDVVNL